MQYTPSIQETVWKKNELKSEHSSRTLQTKVVIIYICPLKSQPCQGETEEPRWIGIQVIAMGNIVD